MAVRKLSLDVRSKLESGMVVSDATQCILELVENSIDAEATAVAVRINLSEFTIEVVDNGTGISPCDLKLIGKRFMTSKCHSCEDLNSNLTTYGYRGQALASIIEICEKVSIKTKYKMNGNTMIKIFRNGKCPSVFTSSRERSETGTTVTIFDFMSTMPVRRKRIHEVFDLQDIKNQLEYIALIHNGVCFTLRDENKGEILLQTHKKTDVGLSFADLFGLALEKFLIPLKYFDKNVGVHGFISLRRHSRSNFQFFYVNNRIVFKSIVHKFLNRLIDKYLNEDRNLPDETLILEGMNLNIPKDKYNVYIVQIYCPYSYFVMFKNLRKTTVEFRNWDVILACIKTAIKSALYFKSSILDSDNIVKTEFKTLYKRKELPENKIKNGVEGCIVKRKFCGNKERGIALENWTNLRSLSEISGLVQNDCLQFKRTTKSENATDAEFDVGTAKMLSESPIPGENYLTATNNSLPSDSRKLTHMKTVKNTECIEFLFDFLSWFHSKLKYDLGASKIYKSFVEYKHNSRSRKINHLYNDITGKESADNNSEASVAPINKFKTSALLQQRSRKRSKTLDVKQDKTRGKRKRIRHSGKKNFPKKFKAAEEAENASSKRSTDCRDESKGIKMLLDEPWLSHQNRPDFLPNNQPVSSRSTRRFRSDIENYKKTRTSLMRESTLKVQHRNNCTEGVKTSGTVISRLHQSTPESRHNSDSRAFQYEKSKDTKHCGSGDFELNTAKADQVTSFFKTSTPVPSVQLPDVENELMLSSITSKKTVVNFESASGGCIFGEKLSEDIGHFSKTISEPRSTDLRFERESKLASTDSLNHGYSRNKIKKLISLGSNFVLNERYNFIPKGLSQSALDKSPVNDLKAKWQIGDRYLESTIPASCPGRPESEHCEPSSLMPVLGELMRKTDENMVYYEKRMITAKYEPRILPLNLFTINKELLSDVKVIGQWDKKFILVKIDITSSAKTKLLAIFDQHAVDERIQLEKLLKDFRTSDGQFVSTCCDPPIKLTVDESVGRVLSSCEEKLVDYGIKASIVDHRNVLLHEIPLCFAGENNTGQSENTFQSLLNNIVDELSNTRGAGSVPKELYSVISKKACKCAVKFNDILSGSTMRKMMSDLAECQLPFQCAHGRPCAALILDVESYKNQLKEKKCRLNFEKFSACHKKGFCSYSV